ncbi:MAG: M10 family metallopeptidase C-terminal domain-containing protein [Candidatus Accumulibacter propinquus]
MSIYVFNAVVGTALPSFDPALDTLSFDGSYTATSLVLTQSGSDTLVSYAGQGVLLTGVNRSSLAGSQFAFADGSLFRQGTAASDSLNGSSFGDQFDITAGGGDTVTGGDGNDVVVAGAALNAADRIDGGSGFADQLRLAGNYLSRVDLNASTVTGIEQFIFGPGGTAWLRLHDQLFASANAAVTFSAVNQGQTDSLQLDGSLITSAGIDATGGDGADVLTGGAVGDHLVGGVGDDSLSGGGGSDTLTGGLDTDTLTGGAGNDRFVFGLGNPRTDSSPTTIDTITDFVTGDLIDLPGISYGGALVFNTSALNFEYTGGSSGTQDSVNAGDGFVDVYWRDNSPGGRLEVWVDGNDDGLFSETDLLIYLTHTGKTSLILADFADNFVAWRGTAAGENYAGNDLNNQAFALGGNDTLGGGLGRDTLYGGTGNDALNGDAGNDELYGGEGSDTLNGGDDSDTLYAEGQNTPTSWATDAPGSLNVLNGGAGNDVLYGGAGNDQLNGDADDDQLHGGDGNDTLNGGDGTDGLYGDAHADSLSGGVGNDTLYGGVSTDSARGTFTDTLNGGDGDDVLNPIGDYLNFSSYGDRAILTGGLGADRFVFDYLVSGSNSPVAAPDRITDFQLGEGDLIGSGVNSGTVYGIPVVWRGTATAGFTATVGQSLALAGSDPTDTRFLEFWTFYDIGANKTILFMDRNRDFAVDSDDLRLEFNGNVPLNPASFTAGTFTVKVGTSGADGNTSPVLSASDDLAFGLAGNDSLNGLDGNDTLNGDGGNDTLAGGLGSDTLYGGTGNDSLNGDTGIDNLYGGAGSDTLNGGDEGDTLSADGARDSTGSASDNDAPGTLNVLNGGAGNDVLYGGAGNDQLNGDADDDQLHGGDGNDTLNGGDGTDGLYGDAHADSLSGGAGNDTLYGGVSTDSARGTFTDTLNGGDGDDVLNPIGDYWNFSSYGDRAVLTGGLGADRFVFDYLVSGSNSPVAAPDRITDFQLGEGDLIGSGVNSGTVYGIPVVWRGTATAGFTATVGQSLALAGSDPTDTRFLEFWIFYDGVANKTILFMDRNRDFAVDSDDLRLEFNGNVPLNPASFTAGTFTVKVGTSGADGNTSPVLSASDDLAFGLAGNDSLNGLDGNDTLNGDGGNDTLAGGLGSDTLYGGTGNDSLNGDTGIDNLYGGAGSDTLNGGDEGDTLSADGARDSTGSASDNDAPETLNVLNGGAGNDVLYGGAGNDQLNGDADDDQLRGGDDSDTLNGGTGNDTLYGGLSYGSARGTFTDTLNGGDGDDVLNPIGDYLNFSSYGDRAILTGGLGADRFVFDYLVSGSNSPVAAPDRITDFQLGEGDLIGSGVNSGTVYGIPVVWRGTATAGFTATVGQSLALAGSDPTDTRFLEFWTFYDIGANKTILFMDRNRDFAVDSDDLRLEFNGNVPLNPASFTAGTFTVKVGTSGADGNTSPVLSASDDLAFGLAGNDSLNGLDGNDSLNGDGGNDTLAGGLGSDTLYGGTGNDSLNGDTGIDNLYGGAGSDTLNGGDEGDTLAADGARDSTGSASDNDAPGTLNVLNGGAGNDVLYGGAGNDQLNGDADDDQLHGGDGNDTLNGGDGTDGLYGDAHADSLSGGAGNDTLYGGVSTDSARGTFTDTLNGGDGDDVLNPIGDYLNFSSYGDRAILTGGLGADRFVFDYLVSGSNSPVAAPDRITDFNAAQGDLIGSGVNSGMAYDIPLVWRGPAAAGFTATVGQSLALAGGDSADPRFLEFWTFYNSAANKTILFMDRNRDFAVDANDLRLEFNGNVPLNIASFTAGTVLAKLGTAGNDTNAGLPATSGADLLLGGRGNDSLGGAEGHDTLSGNQGNDSLEGGNGNDTLLGGGDADLLGGNQGDDRLYGGSGNDSLDGGQGNDVLFAASSQDFVNDPISDAVGSANQLTGGDGNDYLVGDQGNDALYGGGDNDTLYGVNGNDLLFGEGNNDILDGGEGNDTLDGGSGIDNVAGGNGEDRIVYDSADTSIDGGAGNDVLVLTSLVTVDLANASDQVSGGGNAIGFEGVDFSALFQAITFSGDDQDNVIIGGGFADTLSGLAGNDSLSGLGGNDSLSGGTGNDTLDGGAGADALLGGDGSDLYIIDDGSDLVTESNATLATGGNDLVNSLLATYTLTANVENLRLLAAGTANGTGNGLDNLIHAGAGNNVLDGAGGTDTVSYAFAGAGVTVSLASAGAQTTGGSGSDTLLNFENLTGSAFNDNLTGNAAGNMLDSGAGSDFLNGGVGADTMLGGDGTDAYCVDHAGDLVSESNSSLATGGNDVVYSYLAAYTLTANVERLRLMLAGASNATGNELDNTLYAGDGNNIFDGGTGTDTVSYAFAGAGVSVSLASAGAQATGSSGFDTLVSIENLIGSGFNDNLTGNAGDNVLDGAAGTDTVSYAFASAGVSVSLASAGVQATGSAGSDTLISIENLTGSGFSDSLVGNAANNVLDGGSGSDFLNGATGADTMLGGDGTDAYCVDHAGDLVSESNSSLATGGNDVVYSYLAAYTLTANVERLRLMLTGASNGTGNALDNTLYAGDGNNVLNGAAGNDTVSYAFASTGVTVSLATSAAQATGGSGSDTLASIEYLIGSGFNDNLTGNAANNVLDGGAGSDFLNGGVGADTMLGGDGIDAYCVDHAGDLVSESNSSLATGGNDVVYNYLATYTLTANVERLRLMLAGASNGTGNALDNTLYAGDGNNVLDGAAGNDTVSYAFATAGVTLNLATAGAQATGGSASDTLVSIEHLIGSGFNDSLIGNASNNVLDGGAGSDFLNGGVGADTMFGGDGIDAYCVDHAGDLVSESNSSLASGGNDVVYSYLTSYTLTANVERLRLMLAGASNGTGNALDNTLYAGDGNNVLDGAGGNDTVSYAFASTGVTVSLASAGAQATGGSASDTLISIEHLIGSGFNDSLTGNAGNNMLDGGTGGDLLTGGDGSDLLTGGAGSDTFDFNALSEMGLTNTTWDVITDFVHGTDKLDLATLDADAALVGDQAFTAPVLGGTFSGVFASPGDLYFDTTAHVLYGNTDADTAAEFAIQLVGVTILTGADLFL